MNTFIKIWNFLNGKKTAIGGLLLAVAFWATQIWGVTDPTLVKLINTAEWLGSGLVGGGLLHKGAKMTLIGNGK